MKPGQTLETATPSVAAARMALQALTDGAWLQAPGDAVVRWCRWPDFRGPSQLDEGLESVDRLLAAVHPADRDALRKIAFNDVFTASADSVPIRWIASDPAFITATVRAEILPEGCRLVSLSRDGDAGPCAHRTPGLDRSIQERLETFLFRAAHDLISPIRKLSAFSQRFTGLDPSDPKAADSLARIEACASLAQRRVEDLVTLARLDFEQPLEPVDLLPLIERAHAGLTRPASVQCSIETATVSGHGAWLEDLFNRLFLGLEAVADGPLSISVDRDPEVTVSVDVPRRLQKGREELDRVCEPFVGLDAGVDQSTGLALTVCRKIVQCHGGTLEFTRERESALRIDLRIPAQGEG